MSNAIVCGPGSSEVNFRAMDINLLKQLSEAAGIPGREERIRDIITRETKGLFDSTSVDNMGSLICIKKSKNPGAKRVILACHIDEILDRNRQAVERRLRGVPFRVLASAFEAQGRQRVDLWIDLGNPCLKRIEAVESRDLPAFQEFDNLAGGLTNELMHAVLPFPSIAAFPNPFAA